uniref:IRG-type G domain-containing protein n=1 Tax=Sinocyclocheilus grahami TaxID=75366 RepID=A0A672SUT2_SINGR
ASALNVDHTTIPLVHVSLNIAVTGKTGAGKSSFINHPGMPNVKIWDLPGIGSPTFKANKFLKDVNFKIYDFFIILNSERFMENDVMLAKEIRKQKKNFYFVRSKIDNDIYAEQRNKGFDELKLLAEIREDCQKNLKELGVFVCLYFGFHFV